jgi:hypothetical protein
VISARRKMLQVQFNNDIAFYHRPLVDGSATGFRF